ncbi:MAG: hypothetical protein LBT41_06230, partial [Candidatus Methanoplasma sp.]|nr:hypothetical protein [Candidatus Methanoplasma sp.]
KHKYNLHEKAYVAPIDFGIGSTDMSRYDAVMLRKDGIIGGTMIMGEKINNAKESMKYSAFSLTGEIARYLNVSCILTAKILEESTDGIETILGALNEYNEILYDILIPKIFNTLYEVECATISYNHEMTLLREPASGYYTFSANPKMIVGIDDVKPSEAKKSFHADTYCFDSILERECFHRCLRENSIDEIYFTGMFTGGQGDLSIPYIDSVSNCLRHYYPDFLARKTDGTYQLIEVKGGNMVEDPVVIDKKKAAEEFAIESGVEYVMWTEMDLEEGLFKMSAAGRND